MNKIEYVRPKLYAEQEQAIFNPVRYSLIEAGTKTGKTLGCILWIWEQALLGKKNSNWWWVAPSYGQAQIAYRRLTRGIKSDVYRKNDSDLTVRINHNGATIFFKTGEKPDNLYGEDVHGVVMDEASRIREDSWFAIRSTLTATRGQVRLIGNVKGKKNWFYSMCRKAQSGEPDMQYRKITYHHAVQAGILDEGEIKDAQRNLPDWIFRELYLCEPTDDGGNPFGIQHIRANIAPLSNGNPVVFGWDLAKYVDWTVGIGLDDSGRVCRFTRFQKPWRETKAEILLQTGRVPTLIDSTGVGDPIVEEIQRERTQAKGYKFTSTSKQQLMEGLASAIQRGEISYPDGPIVAELEAFEYTYSRTGVKYEAPEGMHDDCVMALALAVKAKSERRYTFDFDDAVVAEPLSSAEELAHVDY